MNFKLGKNSLIEMHELVVYKENEAEVVIGRTEIKTFIVLPAIGLETIELLRRGLSIGETEQSLYQKYAEPFDVSAFVEELIEDYKLVYRLDGHIVNDRVQVKEHFAWLHAKTGRIFFNPISYFMYFAIFLSAAGIVFFHPANIPSYQDFLLTPFTPLNIILSLAVTWFLLFLHEFAHLISARSLGVHCRIGLGHRLMFPVAETDMSGIVVVPRNQRYGAYIAGMCWDLVFLSAGIWLLRLHNLQMIVMNENVLYTIHLINCNITALILFQFLFFMKTDLYYVFTNYFRCPNLLENTFLYFKRCFISNTRLNEQWDEVPDREKKIIYGFAWFYMVGVLATAAVLFFVQLPNVFRFLSASMAQMTQMPLLSWNFAAGMLLLGFCLLPSAVLIWSWIKSLRSRFIKNGLKGGEQVENN
ncbi:PqqD family protein [Cohnella suwonensis]|uniref:PqqD family protein n=1 Tax=Cohnella suwonensis TaxID=696072 RepID=A0ABW0LZJ9_9BACL